MSNQLKPFSLIIKERINRLLDKLLCDSNLDLCQAMRYSVIDETAKRFRAILVYATATTLLVEFHKVDSIAIAVELIHAYSLAHDDLPAMDDDDLRRGKPASHIEYSEATAILVGDALQSLAFSVIAKDKELTDHQKVKIIALLAKSIGHQGMVLGQFLDIESEQKNLTYEELEILHNHKTGDLFNFCMQAVNIVTELDTKTIEQSLFTYAKHIGLAFQIKDDILDIEMDSETIGKPQGSDELKEKSTYPKILGIEKAKQKLHEYYNLALSALESINQDTNYLRLLADKFLERAY